MADDGQGKQEDAVDGCAGGQGMLGVGERVLGNEMVEQRARACGALGGERDLPGFERDGAVVIIGQFERNGLAVGVGGVDGGVVGQGEEAVTLALMHVPEPEAHAENAGDEAPEEDALVARDHGFTAEAEGMEALPGAAAEASSARCGAFMSLRQKTSAAVMASAACCW